MRIGGVRVDRHNHRFLLHPFLLVAMEHKLRDVPLSSWFVGANPARNFGKGLPNDAMHFVGGFDMHLVLSRRKDGFESLYQFCARDGFDSKRADKLDRSRIYA